MSKSELIETVREFNSTASVEFLSQFSDIELQEYIDHLQEVDTMELVATAPGSPFN
ncbi:MAG: hypothetical protein KAT56_03880 [Sedimentisphaerales bacterium]|nr:hypothetical protein [Sedimentisphaerales bacterium]